jgi:uncharacterized protein YkwD/vacuolar-type H+-ATPase subunit F/Vma7
MKKFLSVATAVALGIVLSGCGPETVDINVGNTDSGSSQNSLIEGRLVDSPVEGVKYICADGSEGVTDAQGTFKCSQLPVRFMVGRVILGDIENLPKDKVVTPQDLAGVSRDDVNSSEVCNIARFLQSLDDDGDINTSITIDDEIAINFEEPVEIKELEQKVLEELLEEAGVDFIVPTKEALKHLKEHTKELKNKEEMGENNDQNEQEDQEIQELQELNTPKKPIKFGMTTREYPKDNFKKEANKPTQQETSKKEILKPKTPNIEIPENTNQNFKPKSTKPQQISKKPVQTKPTDIQKKPTNTENKRNFRNKIDTISKITSYEIDQKLGIAIENETGIIWQNSKIGHGTREDALKFCQELNLAGISNWQLPTSEQSSKFHKGMNAQGVTPKQAFSRCTAEVTKDGYVRTKRGSEIYGKEPGDRINFRGGANIRCISIPQKTSASSSNTKRNSSDNSKVKNAKNSSNLNVEPLNEDFVLTFLKVMNEARAKGRTCGEYGYFKPAPPLKWNHNLYVAAYRHSYDMAKSNTFSHTGSGTKTDLAATALHPGRGSTMRERIDYAEYKNWRKIGENIAAGTNMTLAQQAVEAWIKSPPHCKNLMNPEFTEVGLARFYDSNSHYKYYWTQDFGSRK